MHHGTRFVFLIFTCLLSIFFSTNSLATPREIIIIRHADKLQQEEAGPALSAKGLLRSIKFSYYFLEKFGEPDFIVAADDQKINGKEIAIRSIQTVAPLANMMQIRHPENHYPILHPYPSDSYNDLAEMLLKDSRFDNARVLICWSHQRIAKLAFALGVRETMPAWPRTDYDTVYVLKFDTLGRINQFTILKNQFPVRLTGDWKELHEKLFTS